LVYGASENIIYGISIKDSNLADIKLIFYRINSAYPASPVDWVVEMPENTIGVLVSMAYFNPAFL